MAAPRLIEAIKNRNPLDLHALKSEELKQQDAAGMTPLMHAIRAGDRVTLCQLLELKDSKLVHDVGLQIEDQKGMTALMHAAACTEDNDFELKGEAARRDDINEPLIKAVLLQNKMEDKLAEFEQVIPIIVENSNTNFFDCLVKELEKNFPFIKVGYMKIDFHDFIDKCLRTGIVQNRVELAAHILKQPWGKHFKNFWSNKNLVLDAVQMRSGFSVCCLLENDFPVPETKPSVLSQIIQQNFCGRNADGLYTGDRNQLIKKQVIQTFAQKHPKLLTAEDLKAALYNKNLLRTVIVNFPEGFLYADLLQAWNNDFNSIVDFCIQSQLVNYVDKNNYVLCTSLSNFYASGTSPVAIKGITKLLKAGSIIQPQLLRVALSPDNNDKLIQAIEENATIVNFTQSEKNIYYLEIFKYPKLLLCIIQAGNEQIMTVMRYPVGLSGLSYRDAWSLTFENYKANKNPNAQADILALVRAAAAEAKPSQLTISDDAFEQAIQSGDEKLVALLMSHGAKAKTAYSMFSDSSLEKAAKLGHFAIVRTLLADSKELFHVEAIHAAASSAKNNSMSNYLMAVKCAASARNGKFDGNSFRTYFAKVTKNENQCYQLLNLMINRYGCQKDILFDVIYPKLDQAKAKEELSQNFDEYLRSLANQDKSAEFKLADVEHKAESKLEQKALEPDDPMPALRVKLVKACKDKDAKSQEQNQLLIADILKNRATLELKLAEFRQVARLIVRYDNVNFFKALMTELEKVFPINNNVLPELLLDFVNGFLRAIITLELYTIAQYIVKQPWADSIKKHDSNKYLILDAVKMRAGHLAKYFIMNNFPLSQSQPSVLSHILRQEFLVWTQAKGVHESDRDQKFKKYLINALAEKHPKLLTVEDLKTASLDKNLLKCVIESFPEAFKFSDLLVAWNNDFNAIVDFWIQKKMPINYEAKTDYYSSATTLGGLGSLLFYTHKESRDNVLAGFEKLLNAGFIVTLYTLYYSLSCGDARLIQLINDVSTIQNVSLDCDKNFYSNNMKDNGFGQIWKYPRILLLMIQAGNEKIMTHLYGSLSKRDAWSLLFENYKRDNQADILDLVQAAADAKPSQLTISDDAFERAVATGDEKLVKLLIQHGAKVKTESALLSPSSLEKAAKLGHFAVVKTLLSLPHTLWPVKTIEAACEVSQNGIKRYLFIIAAYLKNAIVPDQFPGTLDEQCALLHFLITKHGFSKSYLKHYETRFRGLADEYEKRYPANALEHKFESATAPANKQPVQLVPDAPPEEKKPTIIPVVIVKDAKDLDGVSPDAPVAVVVAEAAPFQSSTPPSAPPLAMIQHGGPKIESKSELASEVNIDPPHPMLQFNQNLDEAKDKQGEQKDIVVEEQVEGSPKSEPKFVLEDQQEGQPHVEVVDHKAPTSPQNSSAFFGQSLVSPQPLLVPKVIASDLKGENQSEEGQSSTAISPSREREHKLHELSLFANKDMLIDQNNEMAKTAAVLTLLIKGSDDREQWQHLLLSLEQFHQAKKAIVKRLSP